MTTTFSERLAAEQREFDQAGPELLLHESASVVPETLREAVLANAPAQPPGTILLQIIRPGIGQGRGKRYYSPTMLEANVGVFKGARMFKNHLTDKERKALDGLPRKIEDLGGRIVESWWDGSVPATDRFEQGAAFGWVKPLMEVRNIIEQDPDLIEASISALATSIKPGRVGGQSVGIVEGIRAKPVSVDWVTEGGAGGRALMEAASEEGFSMLETMSNDELRDWLAESRPDLLDALLEADGDVGWDGGETDPDGDGDDDTSEIKTRAKKHVKSGKSRKEAFAAARSEVAASGKEIDEGAQMDISPEQLTEALATEEGQSILQAAIREQVSGMGNLGPDEQTVARLVEAQMTDRADLIRMEVREESDRRIELRDMRDRSRELVEAAPGLHPQLAAKITERYSLSETGEPSEALNITADVNGEGVVTKPAMTKLVEAVNAEIEDATKLQLTLGTRTRVRGQGGSGDRVLTESTRKPFERDENGKLVKAQSTGSDLADDLLREAGFDSEALPSLWVTGQ